MQCTNQISVDLFTVDNSKKETKIIDTVKLEKCLIHEASVENEDFDYEGFQSAITITDQKFPGSNIINMELSQPHKNEHEKNNFMLFDAVPFSISHNVSESKHVCEEKNNQTEETIKKEFTKPNIYEIDWSETKETSPLPKAIDPIYLVVNEKNQSDFEVKDAKIDNEEFEWAEAKPTTTNFLEEAKKVEEKNNDLNLIQNDDWEWNNCSENKNDNALIHDPGLFVTWNNFDTQQLYTFTNNYENNEDSNLNDKVKINHEDLCIEYENAKRLQSVEKSSQEKANALMGSNLTQNFLEYDRESISCPNLANNLMITTPQVNFLELKPQITEENTNESKVNLEKERIEWAEVVYDQQLVKSEKNFDTPNNENPAIKTKKELNLLDFEFFNESTANENNFISPNANFNPLKLFQNYDSDQIDQKKENLEEEKKDEYENDDFEWAETPMYQQNLPTKNNFDGKNKKN